MISQPKIWNNDIFNCDFCNTHIIILIKIKFNLMETMVKNYNKKVKIIIVSCMDLLIFKWFFEIKNEELMKINRWIFFPHYEFRSLFHIFYTINKKIFISIDRKMILILSNVGNRLLLKYIFFQSIFFEK